MSLHMKRTLPKVLNIKYVLNNIYYDLIKYLNKLLYEQTVSNI